MKGKLIRLVAKKGFGFIQNEQGDDYFFHKQDFYGHWDDLVSDFDNNLKIELEFEPIKAPKGPRAESVKRTDRGVIMTVKND